MVWCLSASVEDVCSQVRVKGDFKATMPGDD